MKYTLGIDPGSTNSAYAFYSLEEYHVFDAQDVATRRSHLLKFRPKFCVIEKVGLMPGQGAVSGGKFMKSVGVWQGLLGAAEVPYQEILPKVWAKGVGLNLPNPTKLKLAAKKKLQKDYKLEEARKRFPKAELHLKKHIDRAEALWIALYAYELHFGQFNLEE